MIIVPASQNSFSAAIALLKRSNLPTEDLDPGKQLFVVEDGNEVIATVAVEYDFNDALLRSLSVSEEKRKRCKPIIPTTGNNNCGITNDWEGALNLLYMGR